ncbi:response regulator transcription factor [Aurantibacillus circumpalustris]|uniref:response regulator transcription factor n=1 Tax=Aurantibacillus circumpalustris TaxID=3036359 RepID=UPI00295BD168|nr:response regulator transcription factor [Aurantibacillus circumpalustris]
MIKILLVEDHKLVRQAWRNLLLTNNEIVIIGEAETGEEALAFVRGSIPDIILLDINLKGENGSVIIPTLCNILPHPKIIVVSMNTEYSFVKTMFKLGVLGYISKNASLEDMLTGIAEVAKGNKYLSHDLKQVFIDTSVEETEKPAITLKEVEIIRLIAQGFQNKEIASKLLISEKTVEGRKTSIYRKLQIKNNLGLLKYANDNGYV